MIDLTPLEVRKKKGDFRRAMRGYDAAHVDDFLELVADRLEELVRENLAHDDRVRQLEQQLRDYKERERALTDALVSAQELREEMREQAVRDAEEARRDAEREAEQIRASVTHAVEREEQSLRRLRARQAQFTQSYRTLLERELEELDVMASDVAYRAGLDEMEDDEPAGADSPRRVPGREPAVREVPPAYDALAATPDEPDYDDDDVASDDDVDDDVDDEALERSLEALQVVFARDEAHAPGNGPLAAEPVADPSQRATQEAESNAAAAPLPDEAASSSAMAASAPVALDEDSAYDEELLLEDAIPEEDPRPQVAADPWLPKLIEDAP